MLDTVAVHEALERVMASPGFANSPRMSRFLRFVVEETAAGRASDLKEYVVGVRVFDKAESFDPTSDPTVRVEASKLRAKLTRYYETDGRSDHVLIEIPKGRYRADVRIRPEVEPRVQLNSEAEAASRAVPSATSKREVLAWILAGTFGLATLVAVLVPRAADPHHSRDSVVRFHLYPPDHVRVGDLRSYGPAVISADGRRLAFIGLDSEGRSAIWVRDLHELNAARIEGTSGAAYPFWSPNGSQIAYFADGKLKRARLHGGAPDMLGDAPLGRGGAWSPDGTMLFVPSPDEPLQIIPAAGDVRRLSARSLHPFFLPDGRRFLFIKAGPLAPIGVPHIGERDAGREAMRYASIAETHSNVVYAAASNDSSRGYLLYVRSSSLMAQPVEPHSMEPRGEATLVAAGVRSSLERWLGDFSASLNGVLVYRSAGNKGRPLAWYDRGGNKLSDVPGSGSHRDIALSPDGTALAVQRFESSPNWSDIWIRDLARGAESRFTLDGSPHYTPVWARNGGGLFFVARGEDGFSVFYSGLSERQPRKLLGGINEFIAASDASPEGRTLLYQIRNATGDFDLRLLQLGDEPRAEPFLQTRFTEVQGQFSPDGRWVAYVSDESARPEVYVSSRESPDLRMQASTNGGVQPRWRRDGREIFYVGTDGRLMSVAVSAAVSHRAAPRLGPPVTLFQTHIDGRSRDALQHFDYDVSSDGQRFITLASAEPEAITPWTVVINWPAALGAR